MKYKTGDVQRILGISSETLRFFENKGLIDPLRNENNNYRYFDTVDLNKIVAYKFYRGFDFSLEESLDLINSKNNEETRDIISEKLKYIEDMCSYYQSLLWRINELNKTFLEVDSLANTMRIEESPEVLLYYNQINDEFEINETCIEATKQWLEHLPFVYMAIHIPTDTLNVGEVIHYGYAVPTRYKHVVKALQNPLTRIYPAQQCVHTMIRTIEGLPMLPKDLTSVFKFIKDQGLQLNGDIIGSIVNEENHSTGKVRFFEMWFPVKKCK